MLDGGFLNCRVLKDEVEESRDIIGYARVGVVAVGQLADMISSRDLEKTKFGP